MPPQRAGSLDFPEQPVARNMGTLPNKIKVWKA